MGRYFGVQPIIVGGVGGSGTRVIAQMLKMLGVFIGYDLNKANDNMRLVRDIPLIIKRLRDAAPYRLGNAALADYPLEYGDDVAALIDGALQGVERDMHAAYLVQSSHRKGWGWKVPAMFHLLRPLSRYFGKFTYVHVIRHGVDMAFSSNQNQVRNWGWRFGIDVEQQPLHVASLQYWIRANNQAIIDAKRFNVDIVIVNFDSICTNAADTIADCLNRIGVSFSSLETLTAFIRLPDSLGRRHNFDQSFVTEDDREALRQLGFET